MESKNFKELSNNKSVIKNAMEIAEKCRKLGLTNGTSLGHHSGFADEVADCIETLLGYVNELENNQLIKTADPKTYRTPIMHLPNGDDVYVNVAQDQAIDIYRVNSDPEVSEDECLCFVEYNPDEPEGKQLMVAAYCSYDEDTRYYAAYDKEEVD